MFFRSDKALSHRDLLRLIFPNYHPLLPVYDAYQQLEESDEDPVKRADFNVGFLNKVTADGVKSAQGRNRMKQFYGGSIGPG